MFVIQPIHMAIAVLLLVSLNVVSASATEILVPQQYSSIGEAIENAGSGDRILVSKGTYRENIVITMPLVLEAKDGPQDTVLEPLDPSKPVIKIVDTEKVGIKGFTIKGSRAAGLHLLRTKRSELVGSFIEENYHGVLIEYSSYNMISDNTITRNTDGISLYYSSNNMVLGNTVNKNNDKGIVLLSSHRNVIRNNSFDGNYWNGITLLSSHNNIITNNSAVQNSYAIVVTESAGNLIRDNYTMRRLYFILPVVLVYLGIIFYQIERKIFALYYSDKVKRIWKFRD